MSTPLRTLLALVAGVVVGVAGTGLVLGAASSDPSSLRRSVAPLTGLPTGAVTVTAEPVRLDAGFVSRHRHGGPTVNLVRSGRVEISDPAGDRRYGRGETFVEPGGRVHTITVIDDAVIDVVRILPAGAEATTEVPDPAR